MHPSLKPNTMKILTTFLIAFLLTSALSIATRPEPAGSSQTLPKPSGEKGHSDTRKDNQGVGSAGGLFGPGVGFNIPGLGNVIIGGGYGFGYGSGSRGHSGGGIISPSVVCEEKGPCYKKKLTCPAKCFTSFSRSGKGFGAGGGGGGCTIDCKKKCVADC